MKGLKYIISFLLSIIFYWALEMFFKPYIMSICKENNSELVTRSISLPIYFQTIIFSAVLFTLFLLIAKNKIQLKDYFLTIGLSVILIFISMILQALVVNNASKFALDLHIQNQIEVGYMLFYFLPTILILPIIFKQMVTLIDVKEKVYKLKFISNFKVDIRILRFIAKIIDLFIVYSLAFVSKIIGLYPDIALMTISGIFLYSFTMEYSFETSFGKLLYGLKVRGAKDKKLNAFRIFVRTIGRMIPFYAVTILFTKMGLHDYISGTEVVRFNADKE